MNIGQILVLNETVVDIDLMIIISKVKYVCELYIFVNSAANCQNFVELFFKKNIVRLT